MSLRALEAPAAEPSPQPCPHIVRRRLVDRLDRAAATGSVAVLVGPAGSGKSVVAEQWSANHGGHVSFVHACHTAGDVELVAQRCAGGSGRVVVVDQVDVAAGTATARRLTEVIASRPRGTSVILCTRRTWLADLAHEPTDTVIDGLALAFTPQEVQELFGATGLPALRPQPLDVFLARTRGWSIATHLAVLAMRTSVDAGDAADLPDENDRHLRSFLHDEFLRTEDPRVRRFLRRCSALDTVHTRLCARICDPASDAILADLLTRSAPLERSPIDESELTIHPLLREVLLGELRNIEPAAEDRILASAAAWHRQRGNAEAAARILVRTQRWDELVALIDEQGPVVAAGRSHGDVLRWIDAVPGSVGGGASGVALRRAALLTMAGHTGRAEESLHALAGAEVTEGELATSHTIRAAWAFFDGPPALAIGSAERALELLEGRDADRLEVPNVLGVGTRDDLRFIAKSAQARARWLLGEVDHARSALTELTRQTGGPEPFRLTAVGGLALLHAWRGDAARARHEAQRTLAAARTVVAAHHLATLDSWLALAHIHRERGELAIAARDLRAADSVLTRVRSPAGDAVRAVEASQLLLASERPRQALAVVDAHWAGPGRAPLPLVDDRLLAVQVQAHLALGAVEHAAALVGTAPTPPLTMTAVAAVQVALARGDLSEAEERLGGLDAIVGGGPAGRIQVDLLTAIVDLERGARRAAEEQAGRAIEVAVATANLRSVVDLGQPALHLLRMLQRRDPTDAQAAILALAAEAGTPLSDRELEIVRFLPTPLRSAQIAAALFISLNTLKTHLASIYRKLGASDRASATERAMELGLA